MWIFTRYGFFSISHLNRNQFLIRARARKHLEALQEHFLLLRDCIILDEPKRDYRHRMVVSKEVWEVIMVKLTAEQTWKNVKGECEKFNHDPIYADAMHLVWSQMYSAGRQWDGEGKIEEPFGDLDKALDVADDIRARWSPTKS